MPSADARAWRHGSQFAPTELPIYKTRYQFLRWFCCPASIQETGPDFQTATISCCCPCFCLCFTSSSNISHIASIVCRIIHEKWNEKLKRILCCRNHLKLCVGVGVCDGNNSCNTERVNITSSHILLTTRLCSNRMAACTVFPQSEEESK